MTIAVVLGLVGDVLGYQLRGRISNYYGLPNCL
jgi:hypothetical protein